MQIAKFGLATAAALSLLMACQEPQPVPDIPQRLSSEFNLTEVQSGLTNPWSVAELPNGTGYLITEKSGVLLRIGSSGERTEITGLPADMYVAGQGGLMEVALAHDFPVSDEIYISYAYGNADANGTALLRAKLKNLSLIHI